MADRRKPNAMQPRSVPGELSGVLLCGLRRALRGEPIVRSARTRLEAMGLIEPVWDKFSKLTERGLDALRKHHGR